MTFFADRFRRPSFADLRAVESALRRAPSNGMRPRVRERVLARAAAGEQVLLPVADAPRASRRALSRLGVWAALAIGVAWLIMTPRHAIDASPTAGTLDVRQSGPASDPVIAVQYAAPATLAADHQLELRIVAYQDRLRVPHALSGVVLRPRGDGRFEGTATLPRGTTLIQLSVASADGRRLDDNDSRGWERVVRDAAGKPLFDGLWLQFVVHNQDDWERAFAAVQSMAREYPDNPTGLRFLLGDSLQLAGAANAAAVLDAFRSRIHTLAVTLADARVDANTMSEMALLGATARDTALVRHWRARMIREYPTAPGTIQQRVFAVFDSLSDPQQRLAALERVWSESGGQAIQLLFEAFNLASSLADTAGVVRWGDRLAEFGGGYQAGVATRYIELPQLRAKGERILREMLVSVSGAQQVPLLASLGRAQLLDGRVTAARDTLALAAARGRTAAIARALGDAELASGDSTAAAHDYAWLAADARIPSAVVDSVRARAGALRDTSWRTLVEHRRAELLARLLATSIRRPFNAAASLLDSLGRRHHAHDLIGDGVAVVAVASPYCAPSLDDLAALDSVSRVLRRSGVPTILFVEATPNVATMAIFAKRGYHGDVLFDDRAELARTIRQHVTPQYFVVEHGRIVRFETHRAADLPGMVAAISSPNGSGSWR